MPSQSRSRRWLRPLLFIALGVALVWIAFQVLGLRVARESRFSRPLRQGTVPLEQVAVPSSAGDSMSAPDAFVAGRPRNLILFLTDGLGFAHLSAARAALHGINGAAAWDRFTVTGWVHTHPAGSFLTESAASATALATGEATSLESIGVDADGNELESLIERAAARGYRTGVVTDSYIWDATPAAFVTHIHERSDDAAAAVLEQLADSRLEVLAGELEDVGQGEIPSWDRSIEILSRRFDVLGPKSDASLLDALASREAPTAAVFAEDQITDLDSAPTLPDIAGAALRRLSVAEQPFVLLIESEEPDNASHKADFDRLLRGMEAIEATLTLLLDYAIEDGQTLLVFTSDHETGGLVLGSPAGRPLELRPIWSTPHHTGAPVPLFAIGPGADAFDGIHTNWEIGRLLGQSLRQ